jgi:hypothetical protein
MRKYTDNELFQISLTYTGKTSVADSPEKFLKDLESNEKAFKELNETKETAGTKVDIMNRFF